MSDSDIIMVIKNPPKYGFCEVLFGLFSTIFLPMFQKNVVDFLEVCQLNASYFLDFYIMIISEPLQRAVAFGFSFEFLFSTKMCEKWPADFCNF